MNDVRLVQPVEGSHFYLPDGTPFYDVPMKTKPGEFRKANIKDAKEAGAGPSTTTVLGVLAKEALVAWKITNAILASLTLPRLDGEGDDDFAKRVAADADSMSSGAADLGTTIHAAIESYFANREVPETMNKYINPVDAWKINEGLKFMYLEKSVYDEKLHYGCKVDAIAVDKNNKEVVIDWKSQKSDKKGNLNAYDEHVAQIAANANACGAAKTARLINVYVSTTNVDTNGNAQIMIKEWTPEEIAKGWRTFELCREIYKIKNNL